MTKGQSVFVLGRMSSIGRSGKMKKSLLVLLAVFLLAASTSWGQCPTLYDRGECDSIYYEVWAEDPGETPPYFIKVPIYVTNDVVNEKDSIVGFVIPLCYTTDTPASYCSLSIWWNCTETNPFHPCVISDRSIFRHMPDQATATVHNRMMDMGSDFSGRDWDFKSLDLGDEVSQFWFSMVPFGSADQRWWEGSRVLLATMTFKVEAHMQICIDTCDQEPSAPLAFGTEDDGGTGQTKMPRYGPGTDDYMYCFNTSPGDVREIGSADDARPSEFSLSQNYPNPFNPATNIEFRLVKATHVKLEIFNIVGQRVRTLVDEDMKAGTYVADWDGNDENGKAVSSGIYFYRMEAADFSDMKKMLLVK
jgi:hypothetical protein